jgi:hypothetical protein
MIHDLDSTLKKLLIERGKLQRSKIEISFEQPTGEWASHLSVPTINLWCYDVHENVKLRNMEMKVSDNGRRAMLRLPPLRFDLTYLVTAWAREVEDEHQLLWRALGALSQTKVLSPETCEGALKEQPYEIPITVAQTTELGVNMSDLWSVLDNQMRLGFNVVVTLALDIERGFEAPLVLEKRIGVGQAEYPPDEELSALDRQIIQKAGETEGRERRRNERR